MLLLLLDRCPGGLLVNTGILGSRSIPSSSITLVCWRLGVIENRLRTGRG